MAKKAATKKAVPKKAAKKTAPKKTGKAVVRKVGRPVGSIFVAKGFAIRSSQNFSRSTAKEPVPGLKRFTVEVSTPELALKLGNLASMLKKEDPRLMKLIK